MIWWINSESESVSNYSRNQNLRSQEVKLCQNYQIWPKKVYNFFLLTPRWVVTEWFAICNVSILWGQISVMYVHWMDDQPYSSCNTFTRLWRLFEGSGMILKQTNNHTTPHPVPIDKFCKYTQKNVLQTDHSQFTYRQTREPLQFFCKIVCYLVLLVQCWYWS